MKYKLLTTTMPHRCEIINETDPNFTSPNLDAHRVFDNYWEAWGVQQQIRQNLVPSSARLNHKRPKEVKT
jgi:hypothetical protein